MAYNMKGFSGFGNSPVKQKYTKSRKKQIKVESDKFFEEDEELSPGAVLDQKNALELEKKHGGNIPAKGWNPTMKA